MVKQAGDVSPDKDWSKTVVGDIAGHKVEGKVSEGGLCAYLYGLIKGLTLISLSVHLQTRLKSNREDL